MSEHVFPLIDRRTPLLDRVRSDGEDVDVADVEEAGRVIAQNAQIDNVDEEKFEDSIREGIAEELDVETDELNNTVLAELTQIMSRVDEEQLLTGIDGPEGDSEGEEESDSPSFGSE